MVCIRHMLHAEVQDDLVPDVPLRDVQDVLRGRGGGGEHHEPQGELQRAGRHHGAGRGGTAGADTDTRGMARAGGAGHTGQLFGNSGKQGQESVSTLLWEVCW